VSFFIASKSLGSKEKKETSAAATRPESISKRNIANKPKASAGLKLFIKIDNKLCQLTESSNF
jgi:hypothetical protein